MRAHDFSGSKFWLGMYCLFWARSDVVKPKRPRGKAAGVGVAVHKASEAWHANRAAPKLPPLDDDGAKLWLQLHRWLLRQEPFAWSEIPLLYDAEYDVSSVCEVGEDERDYLGVTERHMPMRLDLLRRDGDTAVVVDVKTGSQSGTEPATVNLQLATQAVAATRYLGVSRARVGLVYVQKTQTKEDWAELPADELDAHAGRIRRVLRMIPEAVPNRGDWCWRCPVGPSHNAPATCPAWATETEHDQRNDSRQLGA